MNGLNPRLVLLLSLMPLLLGRLRLAAALAGGIWLLGIEVTPVGRIAILFVALAVIGLDAVLTSPTGPVYTGTVPGPRTGGAR